VFIKLAVLRLYFGPKKKFNYRNCPTFKSVDVSDYRTAKAIYQISAILIGLTKYKRKVLEKVRGNAGALSAE
jgi:hypothetical protein